MSLLKTKSGHLIVAIYSANLIEVDWEERTQIIWVSPLLPRLSKNGPETEKGDFKTDLLNYLSSYNLSQVEKIKEELENFDFSQVKVRLVASIPGRHKGEEKFKWGHFKFRKLLKESKFYSENSDHFIGQFSSIGSLTESWIKEFLQSLSTSNIKTSDYDSKVSGSNLSG